eukprot:TRINITY_DN2544_c0_g1_i1.p1 TRINITY_DN2544_c0_g1~~TRINITY_DN2544_c0_g1_i1.p1  ORF type:complete len:313 (-),score=44.47 TRINITY_DN2544_c0_g1_i1:67-1005(-)
MQQRYRKDAGTSVLESENIVITIFSRDRSIVKDLLSVCMEAYFSQDEGQTAIYTASNSNWRRTCVRLKRPLSSVVLDGEIKNSLLRDAQEFVSSEEWYKERGIPYRRGYLLYGEPGCGKTSFILALAGELDMDIRVMNLSSPGMTDKTLHTLMNRCPPNALILMEDVDAAFTNREGGADKDNLLSFSGLLNALDGVYSQEGRIIFMTTNYIKHLDSALIRPGRIDVKVKFGLATAEQIRAIFENFYSEAEDVVQLADKIERLALDNVVSPAMLQGFFLRHKRNANAALDAFPEFLKDAQEQITKKIPEKSNN